MQAGLTSATQPADASPEVSWKDVATESLVLAAAAASLGRYRGLRMMLAIRRFADCIAGFSLVASRLRFGLDTGLPGLGLPAPGLHGAVSSWMRFSRPGSPQLSTNACAMSMGTMTWPP